jgi:error-prone DNA polymerase
MNVRRHSGPFADVIELRDRAKLIPSHIERLAAADCFSSLPLGRRQALWDARTLVGAPELPLFAAARERDEGAERKITALPRMPLSEEVIADYQTPRLSLKAHPMSFLRASLAKRGFVPASELGRIKHRSPVNIAGVVLIRQRPGSAKGVVFITLEDETGVANLVIWPDMMEKHRKVVMGARLIEVRGRVEADEGVIHVIPTHLTDATHRLHSLSEDLLQPAIAHGDHAGPLPRHTALPPAAPFQPPGPDNRDCGFVHGHPRDVRIIPKSRDFH